MKRKLFQFMIILSLAFLANCAATLQVRYVPARWVRDNDRLPIKQPKGRREYSIADGVQGQVFYQMESLVDLPLRASRTLHTLGFHSLEEAHNTNNFDEVPDSTWFTNRLGKREMSLEEISHGPGKGNGPDPRAPWTVIHAKQTGITPGLLIEDADGAKYLLKFDPMDNPELSSGAEVISTRILYAMGYNVPATYIVNFPLSTLKISPKLSSLPPTNKEFLDEKKLEDLFKGVPLGPDGKYRALASKFVDGKVLGPLPLRGKRRDDPNDRIPHQHRRELRGYRYFSAFIADSDAREANTLDSFIKTGPEEKGYVQHYMLDFGSSLGSIGTAAAMKEHLYDYKFNDSKVFASTVTFGGYRPKWEKIEDPGIPSVGLIESKFFDPVHWNPNYPILPFQYATDRDGFWATKILAHLTDEQIAAIVKEAHYSDPRAAPYLTRILIERRDKIRDHWFSIMNPLDNFQVSAAAQGAQVSFDDLAVLSKMRSAGASLYRFRMVKANWGAETVPWTEFTTHTFEITPSEVEGMRPGKPYLLQIESKARDEKLFSPSVDLIIQKDAEVKLLGLLRRSR